MDHMYHITNFRTSLMIFLSKSMVRTLLRTMYMTTSSTSRVPGEYYIDSYSGLSIPLVQTSIQHVVPKCYLPSSKFWDMNNLLIVEKDLNNFRANTKFGRKTVQGVSFCPDENKGVVARICWHMFDTCQYAKNKQHLILDQKLLLEWNEKYPVSDFEKYVNEFTFKKQGTYNKRVG